MMELRRVCGKRMTAALLILCVINIVLFLLSASAEQKITMGGEALTVYVEQTYPAFLKQTLENGKLLSGLTLYRDGFAADRLQKTNALYGKLDGVTAKAGNNRGIVLFLNYRLSDLFLLLFLVLVTADFMKERKKGLVYLVRSTAKGRGGLYIKRVLILALLSLAAAAAFYGTTLLAMRIFFGKCGLGRSIQSLPEYMGCPYRISIGMYLFLSSLIKAAGCFMAAVSFFLLVSLFGTAAAYAGTAFIAVSEMVLYRVFVPVTSMQALRYVNLYALIRCNDFFADCQFVNLSGKAYPALTCGFIFFGSLLLIMLAAGFWMHSKMYVSARRLGERLFARIRALIGKISVQHTLAGWESYKLLIRQGGLLFIAAVFALHLGMSFKYEYTYAVPEKEQMWYMRFGGKVDEEKLKEAESTMQRIEESLTRYETQLRELFQEGGADERRIQSLQNSVSVFEEQRDTLAPILENMRSEADYTRRTGHTLSLIRPYAYELYIRRDVQTRNRAALFALIGMIGAVSGVFAHERQSNMTHTLHTAYRGRGRVAAVKLGIVTAVCAAACVLLHLIQLVRIKKALGFHDISVPVQSLVFMRDFPIFLSIRGYLILLFAVRAIAACLIGLVCAAVSNRCADCVTAMGVSVFVIAAWALLTGMVPGWRLFSPIELVSAGWMM